MPRNYLLPAFRSNPGNHGFLKTTKTMMPIFMLLVFVPVFMMFSASAQNPVPPTARQAAASPLFAPRLTPSKPLFTPQEAPVTKSLGKFRDSPADYFVYANGPSNGICDIQGCNVDAWTVNSGYSVTNSIGAGGYVTGASFAFWLFAGDAVQSVDWALGTSPFASDIARGTASAQDLVAQRLFTNDYGYDVDGISIYGLDATVSAGNWLTLSNVVVSTGGPAYWDENNGPSLAQEYSVGTIPSESFNISCCSPPPPPPPPPPTCIPSGDGLNYLYSFNQQEGLPNSISVDRAGNVFGTTQGGDNDLGMVFRLAPRGQNWLMSHLYSFVGGSDGFDLIGRVGPDQAFYGLGQGGILNCGDNGQEYCGVIARLAPPPTMCPNASCGWNDEVLYRFTGNSNGYNPEGLNFDRAGNIYGTTYSGGQYGKGTVFRLSSSGGSWIQQVLYSFTGGNDGGTPGGSILVGIDGNVYGITFEGGAYGSGVVYQLVPTGGGWKENVIYTFTGQDDGIAVGYLRQDSYGTLYGASGVHYSFGTLPQKVFTLAQTSHGWVFSIIWQAVHHFEYIDGLALDAMGNLYGAATNSGEDNDPDHLMFEVFKRTTDGQFHTWSTSGHWLFANFGVGVDQQGNVYGIDIGCGTYQRGSVWQFTGLQNPSE